jgi:hypothetical protein
MTLDHRFAIGLGNLSCKRLTLFDDYDGILVAKIFESIGTHVINASQSDDMIVAFLRRLV